MYGRRKTDSWSGAQRQNLSVVIYQVSYFIFPQWGAISLDGLQKGEEKKKKREFKPENFIV